MKERPILFSGPMVRAILSGTKTQTRRVLKPQPYFDNRGLLWWEWSRSAGSASIDPVGQPSDEWLKHCPYGAPGDVLWVRETWAPSDLAPVLYRADGPVRNGRWRPSIHMPRWASRLSLRIKSVRVERLQDITEADAIAEGAHRMTCTQGLQWADGSPKGATWSMQRPHPAEADPENGHRHCLGSARMAFANLWQSINGAGSWAANPFVWVIEFEVMK